MTKKPSRLTVLLDPSSKKEFEDYCARLGTNPSNVLRGLITEFIESEDKTTRVLPTGPRAKRKARDGESH